MSEIQEPTIRRRHAFTSWRCVSIAVMLASGCASSPTAFPSTPLPEKHQAEVGGGAGSFVGYNNDDGVVPLDRVGGLAHVFGRVSFFDHVDIVGSMHGASALGLTLTPAGAQAAKFGGHAFSGRLGVNFRHAVFKSLHVGAGVHAEYNEHSIQGALVRQGMVLVTVPMSERLIESVWITIRPTVGVGVPLSPGAASPFTGMIECPTGVSWAVLPWLSLLVEGGYHVRSGGLYVAAGTALSF